MPPSSGWKPPPKWPRIAPGGQGRCRRQAHIVAWSEQEQRSAIGGADLTGVTGAAIQDSNFSGLPAANAFDNNINTLWACNGTGVGSYLGWDYGATVGNWKDIVQFALTTRNDGSWGQNADGIAFDYTDDLVTWTEAWRNTGISWTGAGQTKTFSAPAPIAGLDSAKIEDVAWLDPPAGLDASKLAAARMARRTCRTGRFEARLR
jgi:hypothetical protein